MEAYFLAPQRPIVEGGKKFTKVFVAPLHVRNPECSAAESGFFRQNEFAPTCGIFQAWNTEEKRLWIFSFPIVCLLSSGGHPARMVGKPRKISHVGRMTILIP